MPWPITVDGEEFEPIPESWLDAPAAYDGDDDAPEDAVRLYAVSARAAGRGLEIRYLHPRGGVKTLETSAHLKSDGESVFPSGLASGGGWKRSVVPTTDQEPDGQARGPELEHLETLWADRDAFAPEVVA